MALHHPGDHRLLPAKLQTTAPPAHIIYGLTNVTKGPQETLAWFPQEMPRPHLCHASSEYLHSCQTQPCALFLPERQRVSHTSQKQNAATHKMHMMISMHKIQVRAEQIANLAQSLLLLYAQLRNGSCNEAIGSLYIDFGDSV